MAERGTSTQAEGLLEQIADTALDDDYYVVRPRSDRPYREFNTVLTGCVLAVFVLLVIIAAQQTREDRPATERERATLISDVDARKKLQDSRAATVERLRTQVADLSSTVDRFDPDFESLRLLTADEAATGPGITVVASPATSSVQDGSISDRDLQILINGLWYAGAEAISLNGERISSLTAIRYAGGAITVNYVAKGPPYTVVVLGDKQSLADRFADNPAGRFWAEKARGGGASLDVTRSSDLSVPAAPRKRLTLMHAKAIKADR